MDNNDVINCEPEQTEEVTEEDKQILKDNKSDVEIGKIVFVSCAAGSEETNLDDNNTEEVLSETNSDKIDNGKNSLFLLIALVPEFSAFCVCAIVCILILEVNISEFIQPNSNSCEISRNSSLLKEGIIKDGLTGPSNGNLFLNKILHNNF